MRQRNKLNQVKHGLLLVYKVRPKEHAGNPRVLHKNLLLHCDFLPTESGETIQKKRGTPVNVRRYQERTNGPRGRKDIKKK